MRWNNSGFLSLWQLLSKPFRRRFKNKLFFIFIFVFLIPSLFFSLLSYRMSSEAIIEDHIRYKTDIMEQVKTNVEESMENMNRQSTTIYTHINDLLTLLTGPQVGIADDYINASRRIHDFIQVILQSNNRIDSVTLFSKEGDIRYYLDRETSSFNLTNVAEQHWFQETLELQGSPLFREAHYNEFGRQGAFNDKPIVSVSRALIDLRRPTREVLGVFLIDQNVERFNRLFQDVQSRDQESFLIIGKQGDVIFENIPLPDAERHKIMKTIRQSENSHFFLENQQENNKKLVVYTRSNKLDWTLVSVIDHQALIEKSQFLKNINITLLLVLGVLSLLIALLLSNAVTSPLKKMMGSFRELQKGNFHTQIDLKQQDEFGQISTTFNTMVVNIRELIKQKYELTLFHKQAELKALQHQINPHFLYNTMASIIATIEKEQSDQALHMLHNLSDLFRYNLRDGAHAVSFREELDHVMQYLSLQKIRYGDKFEITTDIDERTLELSVLRLTLQPLVENAIYHGLETRRKKGKLTIQTTCSEENWSICISDDGVGMSQELLKRLNEGLSGNLTLDDTGSEHIGLQNVHLRIRTFFGPAYGLTLESKYGQGTTATLVLPNIPYRKETEPDENINRG